MVQILELFGGIGSPRCALRNIGIPVKAIDYVEIDEKAVRSYNAMFANELEYKTQSVVGWNLKPDILIHGSPCQDFSIAGHQKGADEGSETRSSLMWETIHIIEQIHNITRIRIVKGKGSRYETSEADVYIGWLGILREDKSQISKEIWRAEVKDFAVVPDIRHKDWQKLGLMKPLEPGEHPQYKFSDLTMTLYYTFFI